MTATGGDGPHGSEGGRPAEGPPRPGSCHRPGPSGWRSVLFVPGDRPERFGKALASGADAVCVDLEDAVPAARKPEARAAAVRLVRELGQADGRRPALVVRVNALCTSEGRADAAALLEAAATSEAAALPDDAAQPDADLPDGELAAQGGGTRAPALAAVMLPKVAGAGEVRRARSLLGGEVVLLPLIETALALERATDIAAAASGVPDRSVPHPSVPDRSVPGELEASSAELPDAGRSAAAGGVVFGGFDLSSEIGCEPEWEPLLHARSRVVHAAALAGIPAFDMPSRDLAATDALLAEATRARRLGFSGKTAIHPAQIPVLHRVFTPSPEQVESARRIVRADARAGGAAVALDGRMVDKPVVDGARRTLARANAAGRRSHGGAHDGQRGGQRGGPRGGQDDDSRGGSHDVLRHGRRGGSHDAPQRDSHGESPSPAAIRTRTDTLAPWPAQAMLGLLDRDPEDLGVGDPLPLGWHWLYFKEAVRASRLAPDGHARRGGFMPETGLPRRMWAGGTLRALGPVVLGRRAELESRVARVTEKEGRSGRLVFVTVAQTVLQGGEPCVEEEQTIVYREAASAGGTHAGANDAGRISPASALDPRAPEPRLPPGAPASAPTNAPGPSAAATAGLRLDPSGAAPPSTPAGPGPVAPWRETFRPTPVTLFQFSALTYNGHRIHYDHPYVTGGEGYAGLLVHGPLTALLLLDAARRNSRRPVTRFRYRALAPLFAGEPIVLMGRAPADQPAVTPADARQPDPADATRPDPADAAQPASESVVEALGPDGSVAMRGWHA